MQLQIVFVIGCSVLAGLVMADGEKSAGVHVGGTITRNITTGDNIRVEDSSSTSTQSIGTIEGEITHGGDLEQNITTGANVHIVGGGSKPNSKTKATEEDQATDEDQ